MGGERFQFEISDMKVLIAEDDAPEALARHVAAGVVVEHERERVVVQARRRIVRNAEVQGQWRFLDDGLRQGDSGGTREPGRAAARAGPGRPGWSDPVRSGPDRTSLAFSAAALCISPRLPGTAIAGSIF